MVQPMVQTMVQPITGLKKQLCCIQWLKKYTKGQLDDIDRFIYNNCLISTNILLVEANIFLVKTNNFLVKPRISWLCQEQRPYFPGKVPGNKISGLLGSWLGYCWQDFWTSQFLVNLVLFALVRWSCNFTHSSTIHVKKFHILLTHL